jgi:superfamily I DNA/RNA helicase
MSLWKNGLIDPEDALKQAVTEDEAQAARIYRNYVATLSSYQAVDFDDLIRLPVELFRSNEAVRDKWQRKLRYLLVDEYQDTNTCQYELVKLLVTGIGKKPMFTAVGDDDQAIYAWRGATIENLKQLQVDFPDLKVVKLEQNYRSSTRILQAANAVIGNNPKLFDKQLWSEHGLGDPVKVLAMQDDEQVRAPREIFRLRDPVSRQPPGARDRTGAAQGTHPVHHLRRSKLFRPRRDQGYRQLFTPRREWRRRPRIHPRGHHTEARRRPIDA